MEPELYYNIVRDTAHEEWPFFILVSEMPDKMDTSQEDYASVWGAVEEQLGYPNCGPGMWGKDSMNCTKIRDIFDRLGIDRSNALKLENQRSI